MPTQLPDSQQLAVELTSTVSTQPSPALSITTGSQHYRQTAWHLFSLLLSIGRPTHLSELATRCSVFRVSPDFIEFLCSIPNSPISLTGDKLHATISLSSLSKFAKNVSNFGVTVDVVEPRVMDLLDRSCVKRKRVVFQFGDDDRDGEGQSLVPFSKRLRNDFGAVLINNHNMDTYTQQNAMSSLASQLMLKLPSCGASLTGQLNCIAKDTEHIHMDMFVDSKAHLMSSEPESPLIILGSKIDVRNVVKTDATYSLEDHKQEGRSLLEIGDVNDACEASVTVIENKEVTEFEKNEHSSDFKRTEEIFENHRVSESDMLPSAESDTNNRVKCNEKKLSRNQESNTKRVNVVSLPRVLDNQLPESSVKKKATQRDAVDPEPQNPCKSLMHNKTIKQYSRKDRMPQSMTQNLRQNQNDTQPKERKGGSIALTPKDPAKQKLLPDFESFIVEEEEGSGGYGTVYRARSKSNGTTVAIKCPHANAHKHHVTNELRMLERFGGKNFVIKYEGCFKSENLDCFVLEHVDHDRPEILKKEIDVFQLQSYGYCMFRALASMHKQGVVHRDVKPGNFLFSRKTNKGYLIDFNLAMDLNQKSKTNNKSKHGVDLISNSNALRNPVSPPSVNSRKSSIIKSLNSVKHEATKGSMSTLAPSSSRQKKIPMRQTSLSRWNQVNSQGADGSGITSAKDVTSTRTPSGERAKEPLPCQGRKELINLLHESRMSPNQEVTHVPAPMRKRVAASPGQTDKELIYLTPMPLQSAGLSTNKGDGKQKKEGHCAGTKGFRAPEVCLRSPYQGPKIDTWSAGVTLLYLVIGRTPFCGDPEQNIKDIAKLRGSEELWEIAKLHNRESSFPKELYDAQFLSSMSLHEWCHINTKKRDFVGILPKSLFDLIDKCLAVNPRLRISAEDALKHEFFASLHESMRKQRLMRQGQTPLAAGGTSRSSHGLVMGRPVKISNQQKP